MRIPIVNEQDELLYYKEKSEQTLDEINRDTGLWILNEKNEILLAQRSANKKVYPNKWTVAVAGTVEEGETYESNVIKEAQEEIGLKNIQPTFLYTDLKIHTHKRMSGVFLLKISSTEQLITEPMEIANIKWFTRSELEMLLQEKPDMFTPNFSVSYQKFLNYETRN